MHTHPGRTQAGEGSFQDTISELIAPKPLDDGDGAPLRVSATGFEVALDDDFTIRYESLSGARSCEQGCGTRSRALIHRAAVPTVPEIRGDVRELGTLLGARSDAPASVVVDGRQRRVHIRYRRADRRGSPTPIGNDPSSRSGHGHDVSEPLTRASAELRDGTEAQVAVTGLEIEADGGIVRFNRIPVPWKDREQARITAQRSRLAKLIITLGKEVACELLDCGGGGGSSGGRSGSGSGGSGGGGSDVDVDVDVDVDAPPGTDVDVDVDVNVGGP